MYFSQECQTLGHALIINNKDFRYPEQNRTGSEADVANLTTTLEGVGFQLFEGTTFENLTRTQMIDLIQRLASMSNLCFVWINTLNFGSRFASSPIHQSAACCMIVIMSHGSNGGTIYGVDYSALFLHNILHCLSHENSPNLKGKLKMVIQNTCRGSMEQHQYDHVFLPGKQANVNYSDLFLARSTLEDFVSTRHKKNGTWYIQVNS